MNVKRTELLKALKQCLPGIENGNKVLEGADLFVFSKGFVHSYNDIISVSVPVKSEGLLEEGIDGAVRAEEFYGIINKFNGDLIEFTVEKEKWILKSGKAKAELVLMSGDFTERFENIKPEKKQWLEISPEFTQGLGICKMSNNNKQISGLYITSVDITSSDGYQVNHYSYSGPEFDNFWISDDSASELLKVGVLTHLQLKGTWAHFKTADNTTFSVRTLQAEKWPYKKILTLLETHKKTDKDIAAIFPKELFDAIDRASSFHLDISDSKAVRLFISPKRIMVSAERIAGKYEERVLWSEPCPAFEPFELYVDTQMILYAARRSMSFYIHQREGTTPRMIFTTDKSIHLMSTLSKSSENTEEKEEKKETVKKEKTDKENKKSNVPSMYTESEDDEDNEGKETERLIKNAIKKGTKDANKETVNVKKKPIEDDEDDDEEKPVKKKIASKKETVETNDEEDEEDPEMGDDEESADEDD